MEEMTNALKALQTQNTEMRELIRGSLSQSGGRLTNILALNFVRKSG
jgi:hypothetical protein